MRAFPLDGLFESIVQSSNDAIVVTNADLYIIEWNRSAQRIFGYTSDEIEDCSLDRLVPARHRESQHSEIERFKLTGKSNIVGHTISTEGERKDGTEFPLELSLASWSTHEGTFFTAIMRDSSSPLSMQHELEQPTDAIIELSQLLLQNKYGRLDYVELDYVRRILSNATLQRDLIRQSGSVRPAA